MAANPVMPVFFNDLDRSTKTWTDAEFGSYFRLLMHQWAQGSLPIDPDRLAMITPGAAKFWALLGPKFKETAPGVLQNLRLEIIREESEAFRKKQSDNGKLGGRPKKPDESQDKPKLNPTESQTEPKQEAKKKPSTSYSNSFFTAISSSNSEIPDRWSGEWKIMAHLLQKMGDEFSKKKTEATDSPFSWHGKEMRALKGIVDKIKAKYKGLKKDEPGPDEIVDWWIKFLKCRISHWPNWLHDVWELSVINSKFDQIYLAIKNGKPANSGNGNGGHKLTEQGLKDQVDKYHPIPPEKTE